MREDQEMHYLSKLSENQSYNIKEGEVIKAMYISTQPCVGVVVGSRTKYGWAKQYQIELLEDLKLDFTDRIYLKGMVISVVNYDVIEVIENL